MIRDYHLSPRHYASKWSTEKTYDVSEVNAKALTLATETNAAVREQLQIELLECFHAYLIKYFNMIVFGVLPSLGGPQGQDAAQFLRLLAPAGTKQDYGSLREVCRSLHLAFRDAQESDEVYDTLALLFLDLCSKYDPNYSDKLKEVCDFIEQLPADAPILVADVNLALGFDCRRMLTLLVKKKYLRSIAGKKTKRIESYSRGTTWPPVATFFESGPVGFTYMIQFNFRFALKEYIIQKMKDIETQQGMMQMDSPPEKHQGSHRHGTKSYHGSDAFDWLHWNAWSDATPNVDGNWTNYYGRRYMVDDSMLQKINQLDVSEMTDEWVKQSNDPLFRDLTVRERHLLQMVFAKDYTWVEIGAVLEINKDTAKIHFDKLMNSLRAKAT